MEKVVVSRQRNETDSLDAKRLPVMRTLAKVHECDEETLYSLIDASELDVHDILRELVSTRDVETTPGSSDERFSLSLKGWAEYLNILGSIYELPE